MVLNKNPISYKHIYRLVCPVDKEYKFNFDITCSSKEQTIYKLYSSNQSLMTVAEDTIVMFAGLTKTVALMFRCWQKQGEPSFQSHSENRYVILSVDDGKSHLLYLF